MQCYAPSTRGACRPFTASAQPPSHSLAGRGRLVVVALKPSKAADFRTLSNIELVNKAQEVKRELANVRFMQATKGIEELKPGQSMEQPDPAKVPKGHMNHHLRRQVAQLKTILRERAIKQGISRRDYAKMVKTSVLSAGYDFIH